LILGDGDPCLTPPEVLSTISLDLGLPTESGEHGEQNFSSPQDLFVPVSPQIPRILICGWRVEWNDPAHFGYQLLEFKAFASEGILLTFLNWLTDDGKGKGDWPKLLQRALKSAGLPPDDLIIQNIYHHVGSANDQRILEKIGAAEYTTYVLLSSSHTDTGKNVDVNVRDGRVLSAVVSLSEYVVRSNAKAASSGAFRAYNFVSEMSIEQNRDLAMFLSSKANDSFSDFVNAIDLVAMLVAQICYRPILDCVWTELLRSEGSEVHCIGADMYVGNDEGEVPFWKILNRVRTMRKTKGDICLGYVATGLVGNRRKAKCCLAPALDSVRVYSSSDKLVILAVDSPVTDILRQNARRQRWKQSKNNN